MNNKNILIFGAGENQLTLIQAAKELGVKSIVIDPNPDAPGRKIADIFEIVEANNYAKTKDVAIRYKVDGIVTAQMENPLRLMAALAEDLDFTFPSCDVIENCRNKFLMKEVFLRNEIPCAKGILFNSKEELKKFSWDDYTFPMIIKPLDSHSSRGVIRSCNKEELYLFYDQASNYSSDGSVIVEEWLEGDEYSIEALSYAGETFVIQYTEKMTTSPPFSVETGHIQPANLNDSQKREIDKVVINAIKALGIDNCATHSEVIFTKNGVKVIEIGARLGGDYISSYLTLHSCGINMDKAAIQIALGIKPHIDFTRKIFSCIKYLHLPQGKIVKSISPVNTLLKSRGLIHAGIQLQPGDVIQSLTDSSKRTGFVIVEAQTKEELVQKADSYCHQLEKLIIY